MTSSAPKPDARALLFVLTTVLLSVVGLGIISPVMPTLIMELTGEDIAGAARLGGYLFAVYAVMQFFMSPVLGALSDRFGRRPVILVSVFAYAADFLLMAVAPTFGWLFLGRTLSGAFAAVFSTAGAYIVDVSPPEKRAANFGLMGAAVGLGLIVGPAVGGWLSEWGGPRWPFVAAAVVTFANGAFGYLVLPETLAEENRRPLDWRRANPVGGLLSVSRHPGVAGVLAAYFLMELGFTTLPAVWAYFTEAKYGWTEGQIGNSLAYVGLTGAFVQGYLTRSAMPRLGELRAAALGMIAMACTMVGYAVLSPSAPWLYVWITVAALSGFAGPGMQGVMTRATPADAQGELQGAVGSVTSLAMAIAPLPATQVFAAFTDDDGVRFPGAPFVLAAVLLLLALVPLWRVSRARSTSRW